MWQQLLRSRGELWRELSSDNQIERLWMPEILVFLEWFENPTKKEKMQKKKNKKNMRYVF